MKRFYLPKCASQPVRVLLFLLVAALGWAQAPCSAQSLPDSTQHPASQARLDIYVLAASYPGLIHNVETRADKTIWLTLSSGTAVPYDLGRDRPANSYLDDPDLRESLLQIYPLEPHRPHPAQDYSPGRARSMPWYKAIFGANEAEVRANLTQVSILGASASLTQGQGVAEAMRRAARAIEDASLRDAALRGFVLPLGGGFAWRVIAGETRLSPHSFGTAIDFNTKKGAYWRWVKPGFNIDATRAAYSESLVGIMEAHGFIWGGKWDAFDLMHFEYRPDILLKAKILAQRPNPASVAEIATAELAPLARQLDGYTFAAGSRLSF